MVERQFPFKREPKTLTPEFERFLKQNSHNLPEIPITKRWVEFVVEQVKSRFKQLGD